MSSQIPHNQLHTLVFEICSVWLMMVNKKNKII